jgi:hypothetical protein
MLKRFRVELSLLIILTMTLGMAQLIPVSIMRAAQAQSSEEEVSAPGVKPNEY